MSARPILVVLGVGNGTGTGAATARVFAKAGYRVALASSNADHLKKVAEGIISSGGEAATFPISGYTYEALTSVFNTIKAHAWHSQDKSEIRVAVFNASAAVFKSFLDVTQEDIELVVQVNINSAFAFSKQAILAFQENSVDELGRRGTLIFTGATASIRGNTWTSAFAAGKFGLRALSQSLAKEFGKNNIHLNKFRIESDAAARWHINSYFRYEGILTDSSASRRSGEAQKEFLENSDIRLNPESIAESYLYLTNQERSSWTWELDLRPAHEKW